MTNERYTRAIKKVLPTEGRSPSGLPTGRNKALPIRKQVHDLWPQLEPGVGALQTILKSATDGEPSQQSDEQGEVALPFDFAAATRFKIHNVHHSTCIEARKQAMVGLGHEKPESAEQSKAAEVLNPLTRVSWQTVLTQLAEDYVNVGNCYLEVRRKGDKPDGEIVGVHYLPACNVRVVLEDDRGVNRHWKILNGASLSAGRRGSSGTRGSRNLLMAQFGDLADFQRRDQTRRADGTTGGELGFSEVIHIPQPSVGLDRWYGFPDWLAATGYVELTQAMLQSQFDLFSNRGVPELLLFALGGQLDDETWAEMKLAFDGFVGFGQWHKSGMFNIPDPNVKIQVEKLALDSILNGNFFKDMMEVLSTTIVSAHRVPPPIAGILIPGKMGAANEASNAIMAFQTLVIGPAQHHFQTVLGCTLGNSRFNGSLGLTMKDFALSTTVEVMAKIMKQLNPMDTMGRMRQELPQAAAEGRDLEDGLEKSASDRVRAVLGNEELMTGLFAVAAQQVERNGRNGRG